jgi:hypothetical protein
MRRRTSRKSCPSTAAPSMRICRCSSGISPSIILNRVLLPAPLWPMRPNSSPLHDIQRDAVHRVHRAVMFAERRAPRSAVRTARSASGGKFCQASLSSHGGWVACADGVDHAGCAQHRKLLGHQAQGLDGGTASSSFIIGCARSGDRPGRWPRRARRRGRRHRDPSRDNCSSGCRVCRPMAHVARADIAHLLAIGDEVVALDLVVLRARPQVHADQVVDHQVAAQGVVLGVVDEEALRCCRRPRCSPPPRPGWCAA